jgi:hypothetical protein
MYVRLTVAGRAVDRIVRLRGYRMMNLLTVKIVHDFLEARLLANLYYNLLY